MSLTGSGRPVAARTIAEELILLQRVLPEAELAADNGQDDREDAKPECGNGQWWWTATTRHGQR